MISTACLSICYIGFALCIYAQLAYVLLHTRLLEIDCGTFIFIAIYVYYSMYCMICSGEESLQISGCQL